MASPFAVAVFRRLPPRVGMFLVRRVTPKYTLGVQVFVQRPDGRILLVNQSYRRLPFLPGGALKRGEGLLVGARRELLEETGLEVELTPLGHAEVRPRASWVTFYMLASVDDATADRAEARSAEISSLLWAHPDALPTVDPGVTAAFRRVRSTTSALEPTVSVGSQPPSVAARTDDSQADHRVESAHLR